MAKDYIVKGAQFNDCFIRVPQSLGGDAGMYYRVTGGSDSDQSMYVSWNGQYSTVQDEDSGATFQLDSQFMQLNGLYDSLDNDLSLGHGDGVRSIDDLLSSFMRHVQLNKQSRKSQSIRVEPADINKYCKSVTVSVESLADYKVLSEFSEHLEDSIRQQVRVVQRGMAIPVWINQSMCVNVEVVDICGSDLDAVQDDDSTLSPLILGEDCEIEIEYPQLEHQDYKSDDSEQLILMNLRVQNGSGDKILVGRKDLDEVLVHLSVQAKYSLRKNFATFADYVQYDKSVSEDCIYLPGNVLAHMNAQIGQILRVQARYHLSSALKLVGVSLESEQYSILSQQNIINLFRQHVKSMKVLNDGVKLRLSDEIEVTASLEIINASDPDSFDLNTTVLVESGVIDQIPITLRPAILDLDGTMAKNQRTLSKQEYCVTSNIQTLADKVRAWPSVCDRLSSAFTVLIEGQSGSGKSAALDHIRTLSQDNGVFSMKIQADSLVSDKLDDVKQSIDDLIRVSLCNAPSILLLDDLDLLISNDIMGTQLSECMIKCLQYNRVMIVATVSSKSSMCSHLTESNFFKHNVLLTAPNDDEKVLILQSQLKALIEHLRSDIDYRSLVDKMHGFLPSHIKSVAVLCRNRSTSSESGLTLSKIRQAIEQVRSQSGLSLEKKSSVSFDQVGGMFQVKKQLEEVIVWPVRYGKIYQQIPIKLSNGILLYGYTGCGKTLIASSLESLPGLNFISLNGPEIMNKYVGQSESMLRDIFSQARACAPSILFIDEFESIAGVRGHDNSGISDRIVNQLLTLLDGADELRGVYVVCATSRPDLIDQALLRPGRLEKQILCDVPSQDELLDILYKMLELNDNQVQLHRSVQLKDYLHLMQRWTGADCKALMTNLFLMYEKFQSSSIKNCKDDLDTKLKMTGVGSESRLTRVKRKFGGLAGGQNNQLNQNTSQSPADSPADEDFVVTAEMLLDAIADVQPSLNEDEYERLSEIYTQFKSGKNRDTMNTDQKLTFAQ
ncbi:hypothetical protein MIR68_005603 [Amoeboaphelidium protococcarum]|nr:hypothetical protein MIR68_005603 [Amoeboaphelidium protococcarum]